MKYYVNVEESYQIQVYKTQNEQWWALSGWHPNEILFAKCSKPKCRLVRLKNIFTADSYPTAEDMAAASVHHYKQRAK
jgi:hypothetical protein